MADLASKEWHEAVKWVGENLTPIRREAMGAYTDPEIIDATLSHFLHLHLPNITHLDLDVDVANGWMYPKIVLATGFEWYGTLSIKNLPGIYGALMCVEEGEGAGERVWTILDYFGQHVTKVEPKKDPS